MPVKLFNCGNCGPCKARSAKEPAPIPSDAASKGFLPIKSKIPLPATPAAPPALAPASAVLPSALKSLAVRPLAPVAGEPATSIPPLIGGEAGGAPMTLPTEPVVVLENGASPLILLNGLAELVIGCNALKFVSTSGIKLAGP